MVAAQASTPPTPGTGPARVRSRQAIVAVSDTFTSAETAPDARKLVNSVALKVAMKIAPPSVSEQRQEQAPLRRKVLRARAAAGDKAVYCGLLVQPAAGGWVDWLKLRRLPPPKCGPAQDRHKTGYLRHQQRNHKLQNNRQRHHPVTLQDHIDGRGKQLQQA
jgi:hypothetical protein